MIDERTEAQASLYVVGALPPEETRVFEAALRRDQHLQSLVRELRGSADALVVALPRTNPPPALKQRILTAIEHRPALGAGAANEAEPDSSWMFWVPWALAACFAILCVVLVSLGHSLRQQAVHLQQELDDNHQATEQLREQIAELENTVGRSVTNYQTRIAEIQRQVMQRVEENNRQTGILTNQLQQQHAETRRQLKFVQDENAKLKNEKKALQEALADGVNVPNNDSMNTVRVVVLRPTPLGAPTALGASAWNPQNQRGQLVLENLPPLPATQSYQLWLIDPRLAIPVSGGVLFVDTAGNVRVEFAPEIRVDGAERFAVSIEPRGGSRTPSARIVLASQ